MDMPLFVAAIAIACILFRLATTLFLDGDE